MGVFFVEVTTGTLLFCFCFCESFFKICDCAFVPCYCTGEFFQCSSKFDIL